MMDSNKELPDGAFPASPSHRVARILIVDDERNILSAMVRLFRSRGYFPQIAQSGEQAIQLLQTQTFDVIISDMRMPGMMGDEFLAKAAEIMPQAMRILLTGYSDQESTVKAINNGKIYRYLSKPWNDDEVVHTVEQALHHKYLEQERIRLLDVTRTQNNKLKKLSESLADMVKARTSRVTELAEEVKQKNHQLEESYQDTIRVFISLINMNKGLSSDHAYRVADLCRQVAENLNLPEEEQKQVYFAGLLHELGKLSLPGSIIERPLFSLDQQEMRLYKSHPIAAQEALTSIEALQGAADIVRSHEEHFDGTGFPDGLKGEDIPLGARILSLCKDICLHPAMQYTHSLSDSAKSLRSLTSNRYDPHLTEVVCRIASETQEGSDKPKEKKLSPGKLTPGMILSRDLFSESGALLIPKGKELTQALICKLLKIERVHHISLDIHILPSQEAVI